jgi:TnpA family transposase
VTSIERTAYPRFKRQLTTKELTDIYTPTKSEIAFAYATATGERNILNLLVILKSFQRLGYFPSLTDIPLKIINHIRNHLKFAIDIVLSYENSKTMYRHRTAIREYLQVKSFNQTARHLAVSAVNESAQVMDNPADLMNVVIAELIKNRYELPGFNTLNRLVRRVRNIVNQNLFNLILGRLNNDYQQRLLDLLDNQIVEYRSFYNNLKQLPKRPTRNHLNDLIAHLMWLDSLGDIKPLLADMTAAKIQHFAAEARVLDASEIKEFNLPKRMTLILCLIYSASIRTRDNLVEMFIKKMQLIHNHAKKELELIKQRYQETVEKLLGVFSNVLQVLVDEPSGDKSDKSDKSDKVEQVNRLLIPSGGAEQLLSECEAINAYKFPERNLIDILRNVDYWTNFTRHFGPMSGSDPKLERATERYLLTSFTYGCNLGPTQAARHMRGVVTGKKISFVNRRHVSVDKLNAALVDIINRYNVLKLPGIWGDGTTAAADGTKYELYEENLLSEYHIRYGGYGGIAYHHVSDTYVALFSHFISCGTWEAVYIIEGLLQNISDIQPHTIHADTQGQSTPVFALSHMLGIKLMPRIRNWKDLNFFRPSDDTVYKHIDSLFKDAIDWVKIENHWQDILQVVLSIQTGKVSSAVLLRKLGNYSRKNRLYQAFQELGRVIRTVFLLQYISDMKLRQQITAATNIVEAYNGFSKWFFFGGFGVIANNDPVEQEKIIKYNDLVANAVIFQNVVDLTDVLRDLLKAGHLINREDVAALSPYMTSHIRRFGDYLIDMEAVPNLLDDDGLLVLA